MKQQFMKVKTTDNQTVFIRPEHIAAVEEVPTTNHNEGYTRIYLSGYRFSIKVQSCDEIFDLMQNLKEN